MKLSRRELLALAAAAKVAAQQTGQPEDLILRAMREELERAKTLALPDQEKPYYIELALDDTTSFNCSCSLGALIASGPSRQRVPRVHIRVGSPEFDNTNYVFSQFFGSRSAGGRVPLEDNEATIRREFWLATDAAYKGAVEAISNKRAALRNITQQEVIKDFAAAPPARHIEPVKRAGVDETAWTARTRRVSKVFAGYPEILNSQVDFGANSSITYMVTSEGTVVRMADDLYSMRVRAGAQAADGMPVRDGVVFSARNIGEMAAEPEMVKQAEEVAANVRALLKAPAGEDYSGPALFESIAAPQLFAQLLGAPLGLIRKPVAQPGRPLPFQGSELEGRMGSRILPEWMDAVDDPTQETYKGHSLLGYYPVDMEGVKPTALQVVEKGSLKHFLLSRQPVRGFEGSNGRGRLPSPFGGKMPAFSNLFIKASEATPAGEMKKKLLELVQKRNLPYGLVIRKLDMPVMMSGEEIRALSQAASQRGATRIVSLPVLAYKVYPDGREELVRGLRFRGVSSRSLRDIYAASDEEIFFDFVGQGGSLASFSPSGYVTTHTVVSPAILFEDIELEKRTDDWPKLPLVPPPTFSGD